MTPHLPLEFGKRVAYVISWPRTMDTGFPPVRIRKRKILKQPGIGMINGL
jgi:hypothetical protein